MLLVLEILQAEGIFCRFISMFWHWLPCFHSNLYTQFSYTFYLRVIPDAPKGLGQSRDCRNRSHYLKNTLIMHDNSSKLTAQESLSNSCGRPLSWQTKLKRCPLSPALEKESSKYGANTTIVSWYSQRRVQRFGKIHAYGNFQKFLLQNE